MVPLESTIASSSLVTSSESSTSSSSGLLAASPTAAAAGFAATGTTSPTNMWSFPTPSTGAATVVSPASPPSPPTRMKPRHHHEQLQDHDRTVKISVVSPLPSSEEQQQQQQQKPLSPETIETKPTSATTTPSSSSSSKTAVSRNDYPSSSSSSSSESHCSSSNDTHNEGRRASSGTVATTRVERREFHHHHRHRRCHSGTGIEGGGRRCDDDRGAGTCTDTDAGIIKGSSSSNFQSHFSQQQQQHGSSKRSRNCGDKIRNFTCSEANKSKHDQGVVVSSYSHLATLSINEGNYRQAFEYYELALNDYLIEHEQDEEQENQKLPSSMNDEVAKDEVDGDRNNSDRNRQRRRQQLSATEDGSVVSLVNAAATCFNLGALSKKLNEYELSERYFRRAHKMYQQSVVLVEEHHCRQWALSASSASVTSNASTKSSSSYSCEVCLLQLLVETLQARAHLHYKYQSRLMDAIDCHEQVILLLADTDEEEDVHDDGMSSNREPRLIQLQCDTVYRKIHFTVLPEEGRLRLLATSLQALGKFYVERGDLERAFATYEDAMSILQHIQETYAEFTEERREEIEQILDALSKSNAFNQDLIKSKSTSSSPDERDVTDLERLALIEEENGNWEEAMQCWERVLAHVSSEHGEYSKQVADVLIQLSRCMILDGNLEGALDVCHFSTNICLRDRQDAIKGDGETICALPEELFIQTLELYRGLDQHTDAIPWLKMLLSKSQGNLTEKAKIHFEIGRIYLDLGHAQAAHDELCVSSDLCCDGDNDDDTFELLQRIESLRRDIKIPAHAIGAASPLTAIAEDGESKLTLTEDGESRLTGISDDLFDLDATKSLSAILGRNEESKGDCVEPESISSGQLVQHAMAIEAARLDALVSQASHTVISDRPSRQKFLISKQLNISDLSSSVTSPDSSPGKPFALASSHNSNSAMTHPFDEGGTEPWYHDADSQAPSATSAASKTAEQNESAIQRLGVPHGETLDGPINNRHTDDGPGVIPQEWSDKRQESNSIEDSSYDADDDGDDGDGYESFPEKNRSVGDIDDTQPKDSRSPLPLLLGHESETSSPAKTPDSTTGLLLDTEKAHSSTADKKPLNLPYLRSPRHNRTKGRKGYAEVPEKGQEDVQRRSFVQALASPFRRSRSKTRLNELHTLDEDNEVHGPMPQKGKRTVEEESVHSTDAPVSVIDADGMSVVSQITVRMDEFAPAARAAPKKKQDDQQWWWAEELEGWFPSNYVNKALEAAEGFLSAKAIHVKSRPLEFFSDDESEAAEDFSLLKENSSRLSKGHLSSSRASKMGEDEKTNRESPDPTCLKAPSLHGDSGSLRSQAFTSQKSGETKKLHSLESIILETEAALQTLRQERGSQDVGVAALLFQLAKLYQQKDDTDTAIRLGRDALTIQKAGSDVSRVVQTLYLIADLHIHSNEYDQALSCYSEAQRTLEDVHGRYCEEIADTLNRIGNLWTSKNEFESAIESHKQALLVLKECCGEDINHPRVAETMILIGDVYYKERNSLATIQSNADSYSSFIEHGMLEVIARCHEQRGSYRTAIKFFLERLQFLNEEEDNSDDNSDHLEEVVETLNSLAMLSCRAGLYLEAIDYYDRSLGIQMKMGCNDAQLAMAKVLAGSVEYNLGLYKKALNLFDEALNTLLEEVGEHETVAATLFHIHFIYAARCDYDTAMTNLQNALEIQMKLLGPHHPATLRTRREIGNVTIEERRVDPSKEFQDIIECQKKIHGESHPNIADTLHSLGRAQAQNGDLQEAIRTFQEAYNMRLPFLGEEHPHQATTLLEIAKIQYKLGTKKSVQRALRFVDTALNIRLESLPEQHVDVALAKAMKACCLVSSGLFSDASKLFLESLRIARAAVGEKHPSVAWINLQVGIMYNRQCHFEESKKSIEIAIQIYRSCYSKTKKDGHDHPSTQEALEELEKVERAELLCV